MLGTLFIICAVVGGTLFVCQFLLGLLGLSGHAGVHHLPLGPGHSSAGMGHNLSTGHPAPPTGIHHALLRGLGHRHLAGSSTSTSTFIQSLLGNLLNFQGLVAGLTAFGLVGMAALAQAWVAWVVLPLALLGALAAILLVASLLHILVGLDSDGTLNINDTIGALGTVYLSIPPRNTGIGKVLVNVHDRTMESTAITYQEVDLKQGEAIIVVGVQKPGILEVARASSVPTQVDL